MENQNFDQNYDYVNTPAAGGQPEDGKATASMICGIVGMVLCGCMPLGVAALILSIMARNAGNTSGKATAGLVLGIIILVLWVVSLILNITTGFYSEFLSQMGI